ncbi:WGxxGxxG family protein [Falsiroseomonas sp. E2-1-a20]|uniref:WGxxGxxG family protein n=1 Tax=Falsiroseomonas sp. E2-1-a20 TaxID=3239300 RepID=UPI003F2DF5E9
MSKSTGPCAAALVTALMIGPALTQTALAQTATAPTTTGPFTRIDERRDDGFNWGLLGLLGLAGLAPLFMRKDSHGNVHADTRR